MEVNISLPIFPWVNNDILVYEIGVIVIAFNQSSYRAVVLSRPALLFLDMDECYA